jgi:hypothetical protein
MVLVAKRINVGFPQLVHVSSWGLRKSTVRKPCILSAKLANDFANRPVHSPSDQKEMEADYEWERYFGKRAPLPHHRFVVSTDCSVSS